MDRWKDLLMIFLASCLLLSFTWSATVVVTAEEETADKPSVTENHEPKELDGGRVFARYCGSCHAERYPKEHSDAEWDVIVTHMQVRANLTGEQARAVLRYLQENNE